METAKRKNVFIKKRIRASQVFMGLIGIAVLVSRSAWEDTSLVSDILFFLGAILASIATVGRLWCSVYISGYKVNKLITVGPYSLCRNPLYFFSFLGAVGVGLATETLTIALIIAAAFAIQYPFVIRSEEKRLLAGHKETFEDYRRRVPWFIPSFKNFNEPEDYMMKPGIFRERIIDSLWFVWILGFLELVEALHEYGVLPAIVKLF